MSGEVGYFSSYKYKHKYEYNYKYTSLSPSLSLSLYVLLHFMFVINSIEYSMCFSIVYAKITQ